MRFGWPVPPEAEEPINIRVYWYEFGTSPVNGVGALLVQLERLLWKMNEFLSDRGVLHELEFPIINDIFVTMLTYIHKNGGRLFRWRPAGCLYGTINQYVSRLTWDVKVARNEACHFDGFLLLPDVHVLNAHHLALFKLEHLMRVEMYRRPFPSTSFLVFFQCDFIDWINK